MIIKKMAVAMTAAALLVGSSAVSAGQWSAAPSAATFNARLTYASDAKQDLSYERYVRLAARLGIDTAGLSEEQIMEAVEAKLGELGQQGEGKALRMPRMNFEFGEMELPEISSADLQEFEAQMLQRLATKLDIDITGMSDEEVKAAIEAALEAEREAWQALTPEERASRSLQQAAKHLDIDTTGMSDEEIKAAIEAAGGLFSKGFGGEFGRSFSKRGGQGRFTDAEGTERQELVPNTTPSADSSRTKMPRMAH